jgi:hypothetical protein
MAGEGKPEGATAGEAQSPRRLAPAQADPIDLLIDRVAEAVVNKLEERRKIDLIAEAVLQRIRLRAPYVESPPGVVAQPAGAADVGSEEGSTDERGDPGSTP